jgi:hypothetical protein
MSFIKRYNRGAAGFEFLSGGASSRCDECYDTFGDHNPRDFVAGVESGDIIDEGTFSWQSCDICGEDLGGNRYIAHGRIDGRIEHFLVCGDCLIYMETGDAPDEVES